MLKQLFVAVLATMLSVGSIQAADLSRPDSHAPIGVMGDHLHHQGELMFSYRFMRMKMDGLNKGDQRVSNSENFAAGFMMAPEEMEVDMHMLGAMYGLTHDTTIMVMVPYLNKRMNLTNMMNADIERDTDGIGDIRVSMLHRLFSSEDSQLHLNAGLSLPTGEIDEMDGTPRNLPYPMQLGSGTVDLLLGLTYTKQYDGWSWGSQGNTTLRLGRNSNDYALGDELMLTAWGAKNWTDNISTSLRGIFRTWGDISGQDATHIPMMVPMNTTNTSGARGDISVGMNYLFKGGVLDGHRLAAEFGVPVHYYTDAIQMDPEYWVTLGWQLTMK